MLWLLALLLQAMAPPPLHGGPATMTCAIGGETFSVWQPTMYSTMGARPDGKPYSYLPMPFPVPECPSNHLVMFETFDAADLAALKTLIAQDEFARWSRAIRPIIAASGWRRSSAGPRRPRSGCCCRRSGR